MLYTYFFPNWRMSHCSAMRAIIFPLFKNILSEHRHTETLYMVRNIGQLSDFQKQNKKSKNKYNLIMLYTIYFFWLSLQTSASTTKNSSPSKQRQNSFPIQTTPVWISSADFWKTSSAHPALATWESKQFHRARW